MAHNQDYYFSRFLNFAGWLFSNVLDEKDMLSLYGAKKLLKSSNFIHSKITTYLSENNGVNAIFIAVNLGIVSYQYLFASWFMYLTTTMSGVKKLYKVILQNPILGIFFYLSFYFVLLSDPDEEKFNKIANLLGIQPHKKIKFLSEYMDIINIKFTGEKCDNYCKLLEELLEKVFLEQFIAKKVEKIPVGIEKMIEYLTKKEEVILNSKIPAVYIPETTIETQRDLDEFSEYVTKNRREIKREIREITHKKKSMRNLKLQQIVEKRTKNGDILCLDTCKPRVKTKMGCYCEGDCGKTTFLSGQSWCFVDPNKCKKGKYLDKYMGYTYDRCENKDTKPKCFTGLEYKDCK